MSGPVHRPTWILAFGLALLGAPAAAVPCGDGSCQAQEHRDDASIQLKPPEPRGRSYDASRMLGDELSPGRVRKKDELSPGLRDDGRAREWRKRIAAECNDSTELCSRREGRFVVMARSE